MSNSVNLTALATNLGSYYQEHRNEIFSDALLGNEEMFASAGITTEDGVSDEVPMMNLAMGNILQPGAYTTTNFTDDALTIGSRTLKVKPVKADLLFYPQDFERKWITYNKTQKRTVKNWVDIPFHEFFIMKLKEKMQEELYYASFCAKTANATTTYTSIFDGYLKQLQDAITAGTISQVGDGTAIAASNVIQQLEDQADAISAAYRGKPTFMNVSWETYRMYLRADVSALGRVAGFNELATGTNNPGKTDVYLRGTNTKLCPQSALSKSSTGLANEVVITAVEDNLVFATESADEFNKMDFQVFDRSIKVFVDFKAGVGIRLVNTDRKPVFVNAGAGWA